MFEVPDADHLTMDNREGTYRTTDWAKDVKAALERIPSIDNIKMREPHSTAGNTTDALLIEMGLDEIPSREEGHDYGTFSPHPIDGELEFRVSIPKHVQDRVSFRPVHLHSTVFTVNIMFEGGFPVAFIKPHDAEEYPSMAVVVVREFLREEFRQREDKMGGVRFVCMGPSPMWVDGCVMESAEVTGKTIGVHVEPKRGYDRLTFVVAKGELEDSYEAMRFAVVEELGLFYGLVADRNRRNLLRRFVDVRLDDILRANRQRGMKAWFKRTFRTGRDILGLRLDILHIERNLEEGARGFASTLTELRSRQTVSAFEPWIQRELDGTKSDDAPGVADMAAILDASNARRTEFLVVAASSLGGGLAGAAITALASGGGS